MRLCALALGASLASAAALPHGGGGSCKAKPQHVKLAPFEAGKFKLLSVEELTAKVNSMAANSGYSTYSVPPAPASPSTAAPSGSVSASSVGSPDPVPASSVVSSEPVWASSSAVSSGSVSASSVSSAPAAAPPSASASASAPAAAPPSPVSTSATAPSPSPFAGNSTTSRGSNSTAPSTGACTNPRTRVEWRRLPEQDKRSFLAAVRCLMVDRPAAAGFQGSTSRYEDLVWVHQQMAGELHNVAQFLPWHRHFIAAYEALLRDECRYAGPLPWWDETLDAGAFSQSPLFAGGDYFGPAPAVTGSHEGTCVGSGAFAGVRLHVGPGAGFTDHCLSRAVDESLTGNCNAAFVDMCHGQPDYASMAVCTEGGPHAYGHNGIGAVMSDVGPSTGDPLFFMHHAFIDRNWWRWQQADPKARTYQVAGPTDAKGTPLTLAYVLKTRGLVPNVTVNAVMDTQGDTLCYKYDY